MLATPNWVPPDPDGRLPEPLMKRVIAIMRPLGFDATCPDKGHKVCNTLLMRLIISSLLAKGNSAELVFSGDVTN